MARLRCIVPIFLLFAIFGAHRPAVAVVTTISGSVFVERSALRRALKCGDEINDGDLLIAADGHASLMLADGEPFEIFAGSVSRLRRPSPGLSELIDSWLDKTFEPHAPARHPMAVIAVRG